jgi:hypothetical protein
VLPKEMRPDGGARRQSGRGRGGGGHGGRLGSGGQFGLGGSENGETHSEVKKHLPSRRHRVPPERRREQKMEPTAGIEPATY